MARGARATGPTPAAGTTADLGTTAGMGAAGEPNDGPGAGRTWAAAVIGLILLAAWLLGHGHAPSPPASPRPGGNLAAAAGTDQPPHLYAAHVPLPDAVPLRLDIPSVGIHAPLVPRGLKDGAVDPPPYATPDVAGWWSDGPRPGTAGAAIVVGHVDTETSPAVFFGLSAITRGALIDIPRSDGTTAEFAVEAVELQQKSHFDPTRVYGSTPRPDLRLITCGGTFDKSTQTYSANVVIYATLTGSHHT
ncbi:class F sortase [Actinacidiphila epipremni]|nr:class F sortase [Actinacidiphila epipremni]